MPHPDALEQAFREYATSVYRFLYHHVGNREDAEDLTSEVFLKAAQWLDSTRPPEQVQKWFFAAARSALVEHWHHAQGQTIDLADVQEVLFRPASDPVGTDAGEDRVTRVLSRLSERARAVLTLRFLRGYTLIETATELGITESNVKVLQHRALKQAASLEERDSE
jgi:RNA polymerase sigma factor (sigma-70 family)